MITRKYAEQLAYDWVTALEAAVFDDFKVIREKTIEIENGWVFFYNSHEFIEGGDPISALAGNGPIFVSRLGEIRELPTAVSWSEAIKSL